MQEIVQLLSNPLVWKLIGGYWIFSAFVGALPEPKPTTHLAYVTAFRFFHLLGGNVQRAAQSFKVPGAQ